MNDLLVFEGHSVEVFELNGQILFNPYHVGECLGISNSAIRDSISTMNEKQVIKLKNSDVDSTDIRKLNNAGENFLTESGVYKLIFKSRKAEAERFQDWVTDEVLPSIRKTGSYTVHKTNEVSFKEQVECIGIISDMLRVNDAGKLHMLNVIYKDYGLPANFLPKYEFNGSREIKSATELLKRFNLGIDTRAFNILLKENGFIEERTRRSSKDPNKQRKYKALTEKGLKYGENAISPQNQREVQPLYYADSFIELFDLVTKSNIVSQ